MKAKRVGKVFVCDESGNRIWEGSMFIQIDQEKLLLPPRPRIGREIPRATPLLMSGRRFRELREMKGLSQRVAAEHAGISLNTVNRFEQGKHVWPSTLEKLKGLVL
jgi:DNA-binding XRE family transcriptional regulator